MDHEVVGVFTEAVIKRLGLAVAENTPIYLGKSNAEHMQRQHPGDYKKYGPRLKRIISDPDYIGIRGDGSIEYVKMFGRHVKIAVRVAGDGLYYVRSLYHVDSQAAEKLVQSGKWIPLTNA